MTSLVKKLDAEVKKQGNKKFASAVIFLNDGEDFKTKLEEYAKKEGVSNTHLAIDEPKGPDGYEINKDAAVTVVLCSKRKVVANHAFDKFDGKSVDAVMKDVPKLFKEEEKK